MLAVGVGIVRFAVVLPLLVLGTTGVLLAALVPVRVGGVRPALWAVRGLTRLFLALFGVRVRCPEPGVVRRHAGLVFINHLSYLDPLVLLAIAPARFLSASGVRKLPFIGWMAAGVDTVFVDRGREDSRTASRRALIQKLQDGAYPPIALAPEGQIGPGGRVLPFRHGAFEVAAAAEVGILPVVLDFEPLDAAAWLKGEWILRAAWRVAARTAPVLATVSVLPVVRPTLATDIPALATATEAAYDAVLGRKTPA